MPKGWQSEAADVCRSGLFPDDTDIVGTAELDIFGCRLLVDNHGGNVLQAAEGHGCIMSQLGAVRNQDDIGGMGHHAPLDFCLKEGGIAHAGFNGDAGGAEERLGNAQVGQSLLCTDAHKGAGGRVEYAAQGNQVDVVIFGSLDHGGQGMGDNGDLDAGGKMAQHVHRRGTGVDKDSIALPDFPCRKTSDMILGGGIQTGPHRQRHDILRQNGSNTAINLDDMPAGFQFVQITPDGVLGNAEYLT